MLFALFACADLAMAVPNPLLLETPREIDNSYQVDRTDYEQHIRQLQHILAVRAKPRVKSALLSTHIRIVNQGLAGAFSMQGGIYLDVALLDLLTQFADEWSLAEVKDDAYHQMEFNLNYAAALHGGKQLTLLDSYNVSDYAKEQWQYLWEEKKRSEKVIFNNILGFIIAHEMSHILLGHERTVQSRFPDIGDRKPDNMAWVQHRRTIELEADELAARICLHALVQPAMLVPWLDLNETRRRYYGKSAEYPTAAQRIAVVNKAYEDIVGIQTKDIDLTEVSPLPPHKDVMQHDILLFLDEFRKVRGFRQSLLIGLDEMMLELLGNGISAPVVGGFLYEFIQQKRDLLNGARDNTEVDKAIQAVEKGVNGESVDIAKLTGDLEHAGIGGYAMQLFRDQLEAAQINWNELLDQLQILRAAPVQFAQGLDYTYFFANTRLRWQPDVFQALQSVLPESEVKAKRLKPYEIGRPVRNALPTYEQRLNILRTWDGEYP